MLQPWLVWTWGSATLLQGCGACWGWNKGELPAPSLPPAPCPFSGDGDGYMARGAAGSWGWQDGARLAL